MNEPYIDPRLDRHDPTNATLIRWAEDRQREDPDSRCFVVLNEPLEPDPAPFPRRRRWLRWLATQRGA